MVIVGKDRHSRVVDRRGVCEMDKPSRDKATEMDEVSEAYRISSAYEILNTDLQTSRVLWLLFGLLGTRHEKNP